MNINYDTEYFNYIIEDNISKLNEKWFKRKIESFEKEVGYIAKENKISIREYFRISNYLYDEDGNIVDEEDFEDYNVHEFTLPSYCACYLPLDESTNWGSFPCEEYKRNFLSNSYNIQEIADDLLNNISDFMKGNSNINNIYKITSIVRTLVEDELNRIKRSATFHAEYFEVLDKYLKVLLYKLHKKYSKELTQYNLFSDYTDVLDFSLNQDELAALLFIIQRAGFLNYSENSFLDFSSQHFRYMDGSKNVRIASLKTLQQKFSNVSCSQNVNSKQFGKHSGLMSIKDKLTKVLKTIN